MQNCKYCNSNMHGEFATKSTRPYKYHFFYNCHTCKSIYEGIAQEDKKNGTTILMSRWFDPSKGDFENPEDIKLPIH